jgi:hypothetical protein
MRKVSGAAIAVIMGVALYFTLFWGFDALRMLTSPTYGLDDVWRSQSVFGIGRVFGLSPVGLIQLAAFLATLKFAAAFVCAIYIADRFRSFAFGGKPSSEMLEGSLILVALITIASAIPAFTSQNLELAREHVMQLVLAAIAVALCMVERNYRRHTDLVESVKLTDSASFTPWRS